MHVLGHLIPIVGMQDPSSTHITFLHHLTARITVLTRAELEQSLHSPPLTVTATCDRILSGQPLDNA